MISNSYRYSMTILDKDAQRELGRKVFEPDWKPACEWARWSGLRAGRISFQDFNGVSEISPVWAKGVGEPSVEGFKVTLQASDTQTFACEFPVNYFKDDARKIAGDLVEEEESNLDSIRYRVHAFPFEDEAPLPRCCVFKVQEKVPDLKLQEASLEVYRRASQVRGEPREEDAAVFVSDRILHEIEEAAAASEGVEVGGILIGRLLIDRDSREIFLHLTAQVRAEHALEERDKLLFTHKTWEAVRAAIELRRSDEIFLGWWHVHPARAWGWCKDCEPEKRENCPLTKGFLSEDDLLLHQTVFPRAYSLALLLTDTWAGPKWGLWGWRKGKIASRGYYKMAAASVSGAKPKEALK